MSDILFPLVRDDGLLHAWMLYNFLPGVSVLV